MSEEYKRSRIFLDIPMQGKLWSVVVGNGVAGQSLHASYRAFMHHLAGCSIEFVCQKVQAHPLYMR
jgi:hypothetical protein